MNSSVTLTSAPADSELPPASAKDVVNKARILMEGEQIEQARKVLSGFLDDHDHPEVWRKLAKVYRMLGDDLACRAILRNVVLKVYYPHIMEIIGARIPFAKMIVLDKARIVYLNIPKCGSSSIKDAVLLANQRELRGETSHFHMRDFEIIAPFADLDRQYKDFTKFAVIRHPRDRLRSYYAKNIVEAKSLVKEADGKDTYCGLSTVPSYLTVLREFRNYRSIFDDFRHHTDHAIGYLGLDKARYTHIFNVEDTQKAINLLSPDGMEMPIIHNMKSNTTRFSVEDADLECEAELIASFYKKELEIYFPDRRLAG